jgi:non-homologous end joining protein Ku
VSFRQVNRRTGHRLNHKLVDSITGEAVETPDKAVSGRTDGHCLRGVTLPFAHEVRSEADYFSDIPEMKLPADDEACTAHPGPSPRISIRQ